MINVNDHAETEKIDFKSSVFFLPQQKLDTCIYSAEQIFGELGCNILILGDGNLSFGLSLSILFPKKCITLTVLESNDEFNLRYPIGVKNLYILRNFCRNVTVEFNVDATNIQSNKKFFEKIKTITFSNIIINFPHHGGKTNLKKSKILLKQIFQCISNTVIKNSFTKFHITFAKGQSGIIIPKNNQIILKNGEFPKHNSDSWQAIYIAAEFGLKLNYVSYFQAKSFPGYICSGYLNREKSFDNENESMTLTFIKCCKNEELEFVSLNLLKSLEKVEKCVKIMDLENSQFHAFRPFFTHDLSILFDETLQNVELSETIFKDLLFYNAGSLIVAFKEIKELRTIFQGKINRIYRIWWQGWNIVFSKKCCNKLQNDLRENLIKEFLINKSWGMMLT